MARAGAGAARKTVSKTLLFLKKKKQKDFSILLAGETLGTRNKSFLVLFFKKEPLSS
jgi:hypothetical protein